MFPTGSSKYLLTEAVKVQTRIGWRFDIAVMSVENFSEVRLAYGRMVRATMVMSPGRIEKEDGAMERHEHEPASSTTSTSDPLVFLIGSLQCERTPSHNSPRSRAAESIERPSRLGLLIVPARKASPHAAAKIKKAKAVREYFRRQAGFWRVAMVPCPDRLIGVPLPVVGHFDRDMKEVKGQNGFFA
jgi:hypothetical protein